MRLPSRPCYFYPGASSSRFLNYVIKQHLIIVYPQALSTDIAAGHAVNNPSVPFSFPTDNSTASQIARVQASLVALQNLNGTGEGCPASSTTLSAQLAALPAEK